MSKTWGNWGNKNKRTGVCQICRQTTDWLVTHHVDGRHGAIRPNDVLELCQSCHSRIGQWHHHLGGEDIDKAIARLELEYTDRIAVLRMLAPYVGTKDSTGSYVSDSVRLGFSIMAAKNG